MTLISSISCFQFFVVVVVGLIPFRTVQTTEVPRDVGKGLTLVMGGTDVARMNPPDCSVAFQCMKRPGHTHPARDGHQLPREGGGAAGGPPLT